MGSLEEKDIIEVNNNVEILSTDDDKIKLIGSLLNNDTSRNILKTLFEHDITANEIAEKTGISLSLTIFHLQKMQEASIISIKKVAKNSKGNDMKYYGMNKFAVVIVPPKFYEKTKNSKLLSNSLNKIFRFTAIGFAGFISWLITESFKITENQFVSKETPFNKTGSELYVPIIVGLSVIIIGLITEKIIASLKNKP